MSRSTTDPAAALDADRSSAPRASARSDKRTRILDAAVTVFARSGYHGARVSDIAAEAGIAYGLVYHYFKNKEEILATIFDEQWAKLIDRLAELARGPGTLEARLVSIATLILDAVRTRPDFVKVLVLEIQRSSRFAQPGQIRAVGRLFEAFTDLLEQGRARGELRDDIEPGIAATLFIGALDLLVTGQVLEVDIALRDEPERIARQVVDVFLCGAGRGADDGRSEGS